MKSSNTIEQMFIEGISGDLRLFSRQLNAYRFLCPYCQSTGRDDKGKQIAPSGAKGYLYKINNNWNFECKKIGKCGKRNSFEKFLEIFFPKHHLEYVCLRDQFGTTGFQTNCPTLETLLKKRGMLSGQQPEFLSERKKSYSQRLQRPAADAPVEPNTPTPPKVTKLPPMRSPQQQSGLGSALDQRHRRSQQRGLDHQADLWLSTDVWKEDNTDKGEGTSRC